MSLHPLEGRSGWYEQSGAIGTAIWRTATGSRSISSPSLDRDELEALAESWTSNEPPVLDGYHVVDDWSRDQPIENSRSVSWTFTSIETEQILRVALGPKMLGTGLLATSTVTLPGNGLKLGILDDDPEGVSATASWPGNAGIFVLSLSTMAFNDELGSDYQVTSAPDWTTVQAILGSFRPADAASWANYLASAPVDETGPLAQPQDRGLLRTDSISEWLVGPEPGTPIPQSEVAVISGDPDDPSADPSAAITIESDGDFVAVAPGESFTIELTMTNRTGATVELTDCPFGGVTWSIIDENGLVTPAGGTTVDCGDRPDAWLDGEQRTQSFEFPGWGPMPDEGPIAAVIQFGDNIEEGVTVVIPAQVGG